jgi:single-stranded-DNA-specific exonuclease
MEVPAEWILPGEADGGSLRERVLRGRGLVGEREQALFASPLPPLSLLREPASLPGADAAAAALDAWLKAGLRVAVYGDYDADGLCAAALVARLLRLFGASPRVFIPHRMDDGYGLHADALRQLRADGVDAVVTVDCGIRSFAEAEVAAEIGLRLVITDHHRVDRDASGAVRVPRAEAVAHPSLGGCPFEAISGSVVAFKVASRLIRLRGGERPPDLLRRWAAEVALPLAALGLVPDVMPLVDENRVLVANAIERLPTCALPGVQALMREAGVDLRRLDARTISHTIGPRLNATGRLDAATDALRVLESDDAAEVRAAVRRIEAANDERKRRMDELVDLAEARAREEGLLDPARVAVVMGDPAWHPGLLGLAAARLLDRLHKPVVLFGGDDDLLKASGRAPPGIDLHECMNDCAALLAKFGGHAAAAGGSMQPRNLPAFTEAFERAVRARMQGPVRAAAIRVDLRMTAPEAMRAIDELESLRPFGKDFPPPVIHCPRLRVRSASTLGATGDHLKVQAETEGLLGTTGLLLWRHGARIGEFRAGRRFEVVGTPKRNTNPRYPDDFEVRGFRFTD